ncbi:MAG: diacylglycerol kinase family lipid kinase [Streptococcaceae bacterium]|nr:diacylglycerol kinase family lipid kinase [Streptococcaceae bacterium]
MNIHYYVIINSNAASGQGMITGNELLSLMEEKRLKVTSFFTQYAGQEVQIAKKLATETLMPWDEKQEYQEFPLLVVVGGDGTLNQVLNALNDFPTNIPLAFIPGGSGNDFARAVGITRGNTKKALEQIIKAVKPQAINTLQYTEKNTGKKGALVNSLGIGIDASVVYATNDSTTKAALNKYHLGSLAYIFSVIKVLFTQKTFEVTIEANGQSKTYDKMFLATTTNHRYFGGGVAIAPKANPRVEDMHLVLAQKKSWLRLFSIILALTKEKHIAKEDVHHYVADKIVLKTKGEQYAQVDGEVLDKQEFDLEFQAKMRLFWF